MSDNRVGQITLIKIYYENPTTKETWLDVIEFKNGKMWRTYRMEN